MNINELKAMSPEQLLLEVEKGNIAQPYILKLPLDAALVNKEFTISGNFFGIIDATDQNVNIDVSFNIIQQDSRQLINFTKGLQFVLPFKRIFITAAAQAGKSITILVSSFAPDLFNIVDNRSAQQSTTILTDISDQLKGSSTAQGYNNVTISNVTATQVAAANTSRRSILVQNLPTNTGIMYLGYDNTVSATKNFITLAPGQV